MLKDVDRIEVLTLMDNYVDLLLESTKVVTRPPKAKGGMISRDTLVGEHGLSLLVTVSEGQQRSTRFCWIQDTALWVSRIILNTWDWT